jgi:hypothetical protein
MMIELWCLGMGAYSGYRMVFWRVKGWLQGDGLSFFGSRDIVLE